MKCKPYYCWVGLLALMIALACSKEPSQDKEILSVINNYKLTLSEFQTILTDEMNFDRHLKMTIPKKKQYLDEIIQKEILIQEAKRLNLDQEPKFVRTIERYWEATLIRNLMESKGHDIEKKTIVGQEEIQRVYDEIKSKDPGLPPLSEMEPNIVSKIRDEKKTAAFQKWIEDLRRNAKITTNEELLDQI